MTTEPEAPAIVLTDEQCERVAALLLLVNENEGAE